MPSSDAVVVGSGPNGLAAAIVLAAAGRTVTVFEAEPTIGGGVRSGELTIPGFTHDLCSAVYPMAVASPFFRTLPLSSLGLEWIEAPVMLAHPFDDGTAAVVYRSLDETAARLGPDADSYRRSVGVVAAAWPHLEPAVLGALPWSPHPVALAPFGMRALRSATGSARSTFRTPQARALFGGIAAHGMVALDRAPTAAFGLVLAALAHVYGWTIPRGGAQRVTDALAAHLGALGGTILGNAPVHSLDDLPPAGVVMCDLTPAPFVRIAGDRLPANYRRRLERFRYGPGSFKIDWALDAPIPWRAPDCARAATVHLGGTLEEIEQSERDAWTGRVPDRPFVILVQPSLFDPSRAPAGKHTAWAYCHVPNASAADMTEAIERQIERFAPGFRERVLARAVTAPAAIERRNANFVGGDIGSGANDLGGLLTRAIWLRHSTPVPGLYLCSASTPPGVSVHGMCGYHAATKALGSSNAFGGPAAS